MKNLFLITAIVFSGMLMQAQEVLLKKAISVRSDGDTTKVDELVYDYNDNLKFKYEINSNGTVVSKYSNDTLILRGEISYEYFDDSVVGNHSNGNSYIYYINNDNAVTSFQTSDYTWHEGNMVEHFINNELEIFFEYNPSYFNPRYYENRFFRYYLDGSYNQVSKYYGSNGNTQEWVVINSIGNYPTETKHYSNGDHIWTYYYEYLILTTDISEQPTQPEEILSISYYNLLGQEIEKPTKGFYIERKTTNIGVVSKKYYIQ